MEAKRSQGKLKLKLCGERHVEAHSGLRKIVFLLVHDSVPS
jgi:hypothetical protein